MNDGLLLIFALLVCSYWSNTWVHEETHEPWFVAQPSTALCSTLPRNRLLSLAGADTLGLIYRCS